MSNQAYKQVGSVELDNLIAGNRVPLITRKVTLAAGTGTLVRGSVINVAGTLANKKIEGSNENAVDKFDSVDGILVDDTELSDSSTTDAVIYISGEFNLKFMTVGDDVEVTDFVRELRTLGIFVK